MNVNYSQFALAIDAAVASVRGGHYPGHSAYLQCAAVDAALAAGCDKADVLYVIGALPYHAAGRKGGKADWKSAWRLARLYAKHAHFTICNDMRATGGLSPMDARRVVILYDNGYDGAADAAYAAVRAWASVFTGPFGNRRTT